MSYEANHTISKFYCRFPADPETHGIDTAFLWGSALMIAPVLHEASTTLV